MKFVLVVIQPCTFYGDCCVHCYRFGGRLRALSFSSFKCKTKKELIPDVFFSRQMKVKALKLRGQNMFLGIRLFYPKAPVL